MTKPDGVATSEDFAQELEALKSVLDALSPLDDEGREFVFHTAAERLKIPNVLTNGQSTPSAAAGAAARRSGASTDSLDGVSPKEFLRLKKPMSELQRMVCLAFYLTQARAKPHFKTVDLTSLNTEAAGGRFSNASTTVNNATFQSHFFASAGKGGQKQITAHGEDYVRALPDQEAAKTVVASHKAPRRKSKKSRASKE